MTYDEAEDLASRQHMTGKYREHIKEIAKLLGTNDLTRAEELHSKMWSQPQSERRML